MKIKNFPLLIFCILICQAAGLIGAYFTFPSLVGWYPSLAKPTFVPPGWVFGPAWTILYTFMGLSLYLILKEGLSKKGVSAFTKLFFIHLGVNALWSIVFFGARNISGALVVLIFLWVLIFILIVRAAKLNRSAAILLLPYLGWVSFAGILNFSLLILNP